jgi:pSer/pThr/pTyr-binding forkhead associated (FHA) protein
MAVIIQTVEGVVVNRFEIDATGLTIGRAVDNQLQIDDTAVSTRHAEIHIETDEADTPHYVISDVGSTNGTFVNEQPIGRRRLRHKDLIRVGWNNFVFVDENERDFERTDEIRKSWIPGLYLRKNRS